MVEWRAEVESEQLFCEMCGSPIRGKPFRALVDGVEMVLCSSCYNKLIKSGRALPAPEKKIQAKEEKKKKRFDKIGNQLEIIDGFGEEIKKGRESKGWTQSILAQKLRISEAMLKKIEQEKMKPSIDLAKKIEQLLKIKLLQPVEYDEGESESSSQDKVTFGDVVVVRRDED